MRTVAFYSYKGGTGRTLALANIAVFAARVGKRVVVIDMDLEAPGLTYKLLDKPVNPVPSRGLVGYLLDNFDLGEQPANVNDYLLDVEVEDGPFVPQSGSGWLKLMPAGVVPSPNYFGDLRRLALGARSSEAVAGGLRQLLEHLEREFAPDVVLIDSRTGITATNTLVLSELADAVFAFFLDLPEQLDGSRMVFQALAPLRANSDQPLALTGVTSRVSLDPEHRDSGWVESPADVERRERLEAFFTEPANPLHHTLDGIQLFTLHHEPQLVRSEQLLIDSLETETFTRSALAFDYHRLAAAVLNDKAAVDKYVETLIENGSATSAAIAAALTGDPEMRAIPSPYRGDDPSESEPTLFARIEATLVRASSDPAARPQLASLLLELSKAEAAIGRFDEAVGPAEEAVSIYRGLAGSDPAFVSDLALSLNNLGIAYGEVGRFDEAVGSAEEAVSIYRGLAGSDPAFVSDLALSLNNLGIAYGEVGRFDEAVGSAEEAVSIRRGLAGSDPAFVSDLALSLNNLGNRYGEVGRFDEAVGSAEEAVSIYRGLAGSDPAFVSDLALSLNNLGIAYGSVGRSDEASLVAAELAELEVGGSPPPDS